MYVVDAVYRPPDVGCLYGERSLHFDMYAGNTIRRRILNREGEGGLAPVGRTPSARPSRLRLQIVFQPV